MGVIGMFFVVNSSSGFAWQSAATASDKVMAVAFILAWLAEAWLARPAIDLSCYHTISRINPRHIQRAWIATQPRKKQ